MLDVREIQDATRAMDTPSFLRYLIRERFPGKTLVTCSLRGRSIVLLKMISEIDPSTPIVFCHAPAPYPETLDYRAKLVNKLGLRDTRDPFPDESATLQGDVYHSEDLWWPMSSADHRRDIKYISLNRSLKGFDCWISGVYHGPYDKTPAPRVAAEGRLVRINPLASWTPGQVQAFIKENGLRYHPRTRLRPKEPGEEESPSAFSYHF